MSDSNTQFGSTPAIFIVQRTTGRKFKLLESPVTNWIDQMPTDLAGEFAVSETSGSINGSVFPFGNTNEILTVPSRTTYKPDTTLP